MEILSLAFIRIFLLAAIHALTHGNCVSRAGSQNIDNQCQKYCAVGHCPDFCLCISSNDTCSNLDFASDDKLAINETVRPGTPIFTIQVNGQERWTYKLAREGPVDGSVWSSLSKYLKLTKIGNQYEMIVEVTPDLEDIFQTYGIKLTSLTLVLTCERNSLPNQIRGIILQILPVNEHAPEFFVKPLKITIPENTEAGTEIYLLSDHAIDADVNPTTNEFLTFGIWEYLPEVQRDGRLFFYMKDTLKGSIHVVVQLDFEALKELNALRFLLNVSASDVHSLVSYTSLIIDVHDVDDLPPEFYHPSCLMKSNKSNPCNISYEVILPLNFEGQITNITPGLIQAKDMDSFDMPVKYSLKLGSGNTSDVMSKLLINETTGIISVLSPFTEEIETQLIIEAKEMSRNSRSTQASLYVRTRDTVSVSHRKLDSSHWPGSSITNGSTQSNVDVFMIATAILSSCVLLLVLTLLILCAKLKTGTKRTSTVQPEKVTTKKIQPDISSNYHSTNKRSEPKSPSIFVASSFSTSYDDTNKERSETFSHDHNQQNAAGDHASLIHLKPPPLMYKRSINNIRQNNNVKMLASMPFKVKRKVSVAPSNCPSTGSDKYGRHILSKYQNSHRGIRRQNLLTVSDEPYRESNYQLEPHLLIISAGLPEVSKNQQLRKHRYVSGWKEFIYGTNDGRVDVQNMLQNEIECKISNQTHISNIDSDANNIHMVKDGISVNGDTSKMIESDNRDVTLQSRNKQILLSDQTQAYLKDSSDDYNDKESDDSYKNDSISDASTASYSGSKSSILPSQSYMDRKFFLSSKISIKTNESDGQLKESSKVFIGEQNLKSPPGSLIESAFTEEREHTKRTVRNDNHYLQYVKGNTFDDTKSEYHKDISVQPQEDTIKVASVIHSHDVQEQTEKYEDNADLLICETVADNQTNIHVNNSRKFNKTMDTVSEDVIRGACVSSLSKVKMASKNTGKKRVSKEQYSEDAFDSSNSFSHTDRTATHQVRPHTSDEAKRYNKTFRSDLEYRPTSSAPSRLKRKIRKRKTYDEANFHSVNYVEESIQEKSIVFQNACRVLPFYDTIEDSLQHRFRQLQPRSLSHYLIQEHNPPDKVAIIRHGYPLPLDNVHYLEPTYKQIYMDRSLCHLPTLHEPSQHFQHKHAIKRQRLCSVPEVPYLHLHPPNDYHKHEMSKEMAAIERESSHVCESEMDEDKANNGADKE